MTNYIKADIRRILHKNTFLTAVGIFFALYAGMVFIYFNPSFTADMYVAKITSYLSYFPMIVGLFVFMSVYADDFKCKSMQVAIGYGFSRSRIIAAKLAESFLLLTGVGIITGVLINIVPSVVGLGMDGSQHLKLTLDHSSRNIENCWLYCNFRHCNIRFTECNKRNYILCAVFNKISLYYFIHDIGTRHHCKYDW